ncbi:MAG TPA: hypothetical protein VKI19_06835 [Acidimicrobiales bacterium]|nr:hypothetical protein [Acidimicrobiales bacterium]
MSDEAGPVGPIEEFLDQLLLASRGAPLRATRHLLAEAEAHLYDLARRARDEGQDPVEAERAAVARFGSAEALARADAASNLVPVSMLWRPLVATALLLGGLGGLAMGVSAVVTAVMGSVAGSTFIVNITHHTYLAPSDCARWLSQNHSTHSCYQAALADWSFEVVAYRAILGILGVAALVLYRRLRRRWSTRGLVSYLPRPPVDAVAFVAFAGTGVWLAGLGIDQVIVASGTGAGQGLGTAPGLLAIGAVFGWRLLRGLRQTATLEVT